jgi:membrane protein
MSWRRARHAGRLLKDVGVRWSDDQCQRLGASLSYYAVFSIFPLLLLCITTFGFLIGRKADVREWLLDYVTDSSAPELRPLLSETLASMQTHTTARGIGVFVGLITLLFGASAAFSELEATLNLIWRVKTPETRSIWQSVTAYAKSRALAFLVVLCTAHALLVSLAVSSAISAVDSAASKVVESRAFWLLVDGVGSLGLLTVLFSAIYRMVPRTAVAWSDVFGGAFLAATLFTVLKRLLAWYLGHVGSYAAYGAVGGMLGLLLWIYVASLILFFGAEFTRVYAERYGSLAGASRRNAPISEPLRAER